MRRAELKEFIHHGSFDFGFGLYRMKQDNTNIFVTNHWHDEPEIIYVKSGCLYITIDGRSYEGKSGDVFFINSGEMHEMYGDSTDLHYYAAVFSTDMLSSENKDIVQREYIDPIRTHKIIFKSRPKINSELMEKIILVNTEKGTAYQLLTKAYIMEIIAELINKNEYTEKAARDSDDECIKKRIVQYIRQHYSERITLSDMAKEFNFSRKYFCKLFRRYFSRGFVEYVNLVRVEKAMQLLSEGATVTESALATGFINMSYFAKVFKGAMGYTPSEYRKKHLDFN